MHPRRIWSRASASLRMLAMPAWLLQCLGAPTSMYPVVSQPWACACAESIDVCQTLSGGWGKWFTPLFWHLYSHAPARSLGEYCAHRFRSVGRLCPPPGLRPQCVFRRRCFARGAPRESPGGGKTRCVGTNPLAHAHAHLFGFSSTCIAHERPLDCTHSPQE